MTPEHVPATSPPPSSLTWTIRGIACQLLGHDWPVWQVTAYRGVRLRERWCRRCGRFQGEFLGFGQEP